MTRIKISQSTLNDLQGVAQPQSLSNSEPGRDGSLGNPYSWEEYLNLTDEELAASPCYYINYNGVTSYSLATVIVEALYNTEYENTEDESTWIDNFVEEATSFANSAYSYIVEGFQSMVTNPFAQALTWYDLGIGNKLTLDLQNLGLNDITMEQLMQYSHVTDPHATYYPVNLSSSQNLPSLIRNSSDPVLTISTAMTLGNITFKRINGDNFTLIPDQYNFDMHKWGEESERNIGTIIGWCINENLSIYADFLLGSGLGVLLGLVRRHGKDTSFTIDFSGVLTIH